MWCFFLWRTNTSFQESSLKSSVIVSPGVDCPEKVSHQPLPWIQVGKSDVLFTFWHSGTFFLCLARLWICLTFFCWNSATNSGTNQHKLSYLWNLMILLHSNPVLFFTIFDSGGALFTRGAMTEQGKSHGLQKLYAWQKCHNREMIFCHLWYSNVTNQEWFQWPSFHYLILTSKFACSMS